MPRRKKQKPRNTERVNPNELKTRDPLLLALINGATKSGVQKDRRKERNRRECRDRRKYAEDD